MSGLRDIEGRCLMCGQAEPLTCDEERHEAVKQRGWINHGAYEASHLVDEPCPVAKCKQDEPEPVRGPAEPPLELQQRLTALAMGLQVGQVGLGQWRRGDKGPVEWLITARVRAGGGLVLMPLGRFFTGPQELGWVPVDADGLPIAAPTGTPEALAPPRHQAERLN